MHTLPHYPHLTRLFPHPCIFTFSCQLLNHLFQPLKKIRSETFHRLIILTWRSVCPTSPSSSAPVPAYSPSRGSSSPNAWKEKKVSEVCFGKSNSWMVVIPNSPHNIQEEHYHMPSLCSKTGDVVMIETLNALAQFGQLLS